MHLRDDIERAELARDKALAAHDRAVAVSCCHYYSACGSKLAFSHVAITDADRHGKLGNNASCHLL